MSVKETLNKIREESISLTMRQKILKVLLFLALGMFLGFIAKYSDTIPSNGFMRSIWHIISNITTRLGIWVLLATIIAAWSNNPKIAAIKVFAFFSGMLLIYYVYSMKLFGCFPTYYFIHWGGIALISPIAAYAVWFSRGNGWIAALFSAIPIGLLISEGYHIFYIFTITLGFDILFAMILFVILPMNKKQWLRIFILTLFIVFIFIKMHVLSYIFGGL